MNKFCKYKLSIKKIKKWFNDTLFKKLAINSGMLMTGTIIANALGFLTTIVKTRALGVELFGLLSAVIAFVVIVNRLTSVNTWQPLIKYGAESLLNHDKKELMEYVNLSVLLDICSVVLGLIGSLSIAYFFSDIFGLDREIKNFIFVYSVIIIFNLTYPIGIIRLFDKFKYIAVEQVITALFSLIGALMVSYLNGGVREFLWIMVIAKAVGTFYIVFVTYNLLRRQGYLVFWRSFPKVWKPFLKFGWWTYLTSASDVPIKQLDILVVTAVISLEATGIYKIIKQVIGFYGLLADPIYQAVFPQFSRMIASKDNKKALKYAIKIGAIIFLIMVLPTLILAGTSPWWLDAIFGEGFSIAALPLAIFLFFKIFSVSAIVIHPLLVSFGFVKQNMIIILYSNIIYLLFAFIFGTSFGLIGMSLAYGVQFTVMIVSKAFIIRKNVLQPLGSL